MSTTGPSAPRSKPTGTSCSLATASPERKVFVRRRRSRSVDSRRSRKENTKDMLVPGKKRKTAPLEEMPKSPGSSLEMMMPPAQQTRKRKESRGRPQLSADSDGSHWVKPKHRGVMTSHDEAKSDNRDSTARATSAVPSPIASTQIGGSTSLDVDSLRQQVVDLKKETEAAKKSAASHKQEIENLRRELAAAKKMNRKQGSQIEKLKSSGKKSDEVLASIQGNLQCQICLEMLLKPYALSPCGHVLCQKCLQEWFRSAPAQPHEEDEDGPIPTLFRRKTCPCCRAVIYSRPIQLFLLKSIASSLAPDVPPPVPAPDDAPPDADPWADIFPEEIDMSDEDYHDEDIDPDAWSIDMGFSGSEHDYGYGYGSDSDAEPYEGEYVRPEWAPPFHDIDPEDDPDITPNELRMLQRGASLGMIHRFDMRYDTEYGLVATTDEDHDVFLGWNIELEDDDDDGEDFMNWIEDDIIERSERWDVQEDIRGEWVAWRLVREDDGGANEAY